MKRIIALLLVSIFTIVLAAGCDASDKKTAQKEDSEKTALMPYEIEFGMTYDEVKALDTSALELKDATANDGYVCGLHEADWEFLADFYNIQVESDEIVKIPPWFPEYGYSFNQEKELYEYYIFSTIFTEDTAETVYNDFVTYFSEKVGAEAVNDETASTLTTTFKTKELNVSISLEEQSDGSFTFILTLHDFTHDLNS